MPAPETRRGGPDQAASRNRSSSPRTATLQPPGAPEQARGDPPPIAVIPKNRTEEIRVGLSQFNGHDLINVRVWADRRDGADGRVPTKAGIACRVALLPDLIEALQQVEAEARKKGLLR